MYERLNLCMYVYLLIMALAIKGIQTRYIEIENLRVQTHSSICRFANMIRE